MTEPLAIDSKRTAVVVLDYQVGVLGMMPEFEALLERAARVLSSAREAALPVIYVVVEFRPGHPEIDPRNVAMAQRVKQSGAFVTGSPAVQIHPSVAPRDGDSVVVKRRIGAFSGTELEMILRARSIDTLILFGVATSGAVLTTVRQGFDADYRMIVVRDCCADPDAEVHGLLLDKVLARQAAAVVTADALVSQLTK